ncbi:carboxymuconolactone decarboxylase family protein [Trinickia mobilis]|uniref:carboxymuconolactone decarboxylase family protein n=1 Tax=Trinickia mobilis TaxID=2816356 RepID=UPI001A8D2276|nr:carboxymuconolactone decarboxylase family protein [Trinickia mobilis]
MENGNAERGRDRLSAVTGARGEQVIESLAEICPDFGRYITEFAYGEIHLRPGLTPQQRELLIVATLAALGNAQPQLNVHLAAALKVGVSRTEIVEAMIQLSVYAGFPAALNGLWAAKAVFEQQDLAASARAQSA